MRVPSVCFLLSFAVALLAAPTQRLWAQEPPPPSAIVVPYEPAALTVADEAKSQRAEAFNDAIAKLKIVCREYDERDRSFFDVLKQCLHLNDTYQESLHTSAARERFERQQLAFVRSLETEVKQRHEHQRATALDAHRARFLRLTVERHTLSHTAPVDAAPRASATPVPSASPPAMPVQASAPAIKALDARITAKMLDLRTSPSRSQNFWSPSASFAAVVETNDGLLFKLALWDLDAGKLVRYLSASEGEGTKPYEGKDDADFGAAVSFSEMRIERIFFSPDNKYVVGHVSLAGATRPPGDHTQQVLIWEVASGRLARTLNLGNLHSGNFFFIDPVHFVTKVMTSSSVSLDLVDVRTGKSEHLMPPNNFEMYCSNSRNGLIPMLTPAAIATLNISTKAVVPFPPNPPEASQAAVQQLWFSRDGRQLFVRRGNHVDIWNPRTRQFVRSTAIQPPEARMNMLQIAEDAVLIARDNWEASKLEFYDLVQGEVQLSIDTGRQYRALLGISPDARRIGLIGEGNLVLLLDFPGGLPKGTVNISQLLERTKGEIHR